VTADEAADNFVKEVTTVLTDLQKFLTSNSDARQAVDKESLQSLKDNIAELRAKINSQTAARSNFLTTNLHDLKDNLVGLTNKLWA
jgi:septal ring factor EnvC (AmiA/AmiB activator)